MASLDILRFNPFNLKNRIMKIERKEIFCGPSKILKNISWPINICLKYFMTPTKTLRPSLLHISCTVPNLTKLKEFVIGRNNVSILSSHFAVMNGIS